MIKSKPVAEYIPGKLFSVRLSDKVVLAAFAGDDTMGAMDVTELIGSGDIARPMSAADEISR